MDNPFLAARNENNGNLIRRGGPSGKRNRNSGNGGGGGIGNGGANNGNGGNGGAGDNGKTVGKNEAKNWQKTNPYEYYMGLLTNSNLNLNPTGDTRFQDWFGTTYYNQLHNDYLSKYNTEGADATVTWADYLDTALANTQSDWQNYFGDAYRPEAITNAFTNNGLGAAGDPGNAFGTWLNTRMGGQLQSAWEASKGESGQTFNEYLQQQANSGVFGNFYDQYMMDPNRWKQTYNMGRWQAF